MGAKHADRMWNLSEKLLEKESCILAWEKAPVSLQGLFPLAPANHLDGLDTASLFAVGYRTDTKSFSPHGSTSFPQVNCQVLAPLLLRPATHGKTIHYVFLCTAVLDHGLAFRLDVVSSDLKAIPIFEFRNVDTALLFHIGHPLSMF